MIRRKFYIVIVVALMGLLPAALWAQGSGLTLESLAKTVKTITEHVDDLQTDHQAMRRRFDILSARVATLEAGEVPETDGPLLCVLALRNTVSSVSLQAYREDFPESPLPDRYEIVSVGRLPLGQVAVRFEAFWDDGVRVSHGNRFVLETYYDCKIEFIYWLDG